MNREAIFSDGTTEYVNPWEPEAGDKVILRIRVAHGEQPNVFLVTKNDETAMTLDEVGQVFDYYRATILISDWTFSYIFRIEKDGEVVYFDRYGLTEERRFHYAFMIVPGFKTPEWTKGAVMYQILVDRFYNGDKTNDVETNEYYYIGSFSQKIGNWRQNPANMDVGNFYGGDLEGVRQKMYYLKSLGVEVIYFNPLFVSPSNHKYDSQDYEYIDPHYGKIVVDGGELLKDGDRDNSHATKYQTRVSDQRNLDASNQFFADFVREAHARGIRVILDGVFNHTGSFNKWLDRERIYEGKPGYAPGAFVAKESPYHDYFSFNGGDWPYNTNYNGWWGHDTLPKLNYEGSKELEEKILSIAKKWVSPPYSCDGWRLDVAADLGHSEEYNHYFWKEFRRVVKEANPEAVILAEHYGDASSWLRGDQWDTIMNYDAFMEPVTFFLTGMEKHSDEYHPELLGDGGHFEMVMRHTMTEFLTPSLYSAMNQLSNHDHSRFLTRTNHKVGRVQNLGSKAAEEGVNIAVFKQATLMLFTWPGAPTLYYGDEAGLCGFTDPDNRRTYPWDNADYRLIDYTRDMIMLHKAHEPLKTGAFMFVKCEASLVSYARFTKNQKMVVVVNGSDHELKTTIPVWKAEVPMETTMHQILVTNEIGYSIMPIRVPVKNGEVELTLKAHEALILRKTI